MTTRTRRDAECYDDVKTFSVLAAEGFLPGYGLEVGAVLCTAEIPFWRTGAMEFSLPRPPIADCENAGAARSLRRRITGPSCARVPPCQAQEELF
jgi:hypothetical protein